ncbi:MAG: hypothetical protein ACI8Y7_000708 [Candidatus Woesearchaeota archaeon]|jgi:hypothetical protein
MFKLIRGDSENLRGSALTVVQYTGDLKHLNGKLKPDFIQAVREDKNSCLELALFSSRKMEDIAKQAQIHGMSINEEKIAEELNHTTISLDGTAAVGVLFQANFFYTAKEYLTTPFDILHLG